MRFLLEIIFCIAAAYGIGWFVSNYGGRVAAQQSDWLKGARTRTGALALVIPGEEKQVQPGMRPVRDRKWLS